VFHARVEDGNVESVHGSAWEPALTVTSDRDTFRELASGELSLERAARTHRISVEGDRRALRRFERIFRRPEPASLAAELPAKATNAA
jgi:alkyl sulfatase BDS1-like metallo-beta-lactamase superfamily hydrolase